MKKLLLSLLLGLVSTGGFAEDSYKFFTLNLSDGTYVSHRLDGLKLLFDKGTVDLITPNGTKSYAPNEISNMIYSVDDLTTTGIAAVGSSNDAIVSVYTTDGRLVSKGQKALRTLSPGTYIVKTADRTTKIFVR